MENAGGSLLPWCGWIAATNIFKSHLSGACPDRIGNRHPLPPGNDINTVHSLTSAKDSYEILS
jgi:hypothetical protein